MTPALSDRELLAKRVHEIREAWAERYGIDDEEWVLDGAAGPNRRSPTPEQVWELQRAIREVSGQDPATGRYLRSPEAAVVTYREIRDAVERRWAADPPERDARIARVDAALRAWRARTGVEDRLWDADALAIAPEFLPTAEGWALVRAVRVAAGQDPVRGVFVA